MGRVRNRATTVGADVDVVPPKVTQLLFPKPHKFVVKGKPDEEPLTQVETAKVHKLRSPVNSNVRLKSYRSVVNRGLIPEFVKYGMSTQPTLKEIQDYHDVWEMQGFGRGAIVARRFGIEANWQNPGMWGMIVVVSTSHHTPQLPFAPYIVKWINDGHGEPAWAEDLYIINQSLDDRLVLELIEAQGGPWEPGTEE